MSNLVPVNVNIPAHLAARIGAPSVLAQSVMAGLGGGPAYPKISIKGSRFRIKEGSTETVLNTLELDVVIVGANPRLSKTWYAAKWDPNAEPNAPDCYSLDGVSPAADAANPQNDLCASCPKNAWGSEVTEKGQQLKACSDFKRLAVVAADDASGPVYLLEVTPAALKGLNQYQRELTMRGIPAEVVKTKVSFDTDASFPKLKFGFGGFLDADTQAVVDGLFGTPEVLEVTGEAAASAPQPAPVAAPAPAPKPQVAPKPVAVVAPPPPAPAPAPTPAAEAAPRRGFGASKPAAPVAEAPVAAPAPAPRVVRARAAAPAAAPAAPAAAPTAPAAVASLADEIAALVGEVGADDA